MKNAGIFSIESIDEIIPFNSEQKTTAATEPVVTDDEDKENKLVAISGPLSQTYTQALKIVYNKVEGVDGYLATESMANDAIINMSIISAVLTHTNNVKNNTYTNDENTSQDPVDYSVYTVHENDINPETVGNMAENMTRDTAVSPNAKKIAIIDTSAELSQLGTVTTTDEIKTAFEKYCNNNDIKVMKLNITVPADARKFAGLFKLRKRS